MGPNVASLVHLYRYGSKCCLFSASMGPKSNVASSSSPVLHSLSPLVCKWFISLARREPFTAAVWLASGDVGYQGYLDFLLGKVVGVATQERGVAPEQQQTTKPSVGRQEATRQEATRHKAERCANEEKEAKPVVRRGEEGGEEEGGRGEEEGRRGEEGEGRRKDGEGEGRRRKDEEGEGRRKDGEGEGRRKDGE